MRFAKFCLAVCLFFAWVPARAEVAFLRGDVDQSGYLDLTDSVRLLNFLFLGGAAPGAPYPNCSEDPTEDQLGCASYSAPNCSRLPRLLSAMAPSNHFVAIELDVPIDGGIAEMLLRTNAY